MPCTFVTIRGLICEVLALPLMPAYEAGANLTQLAGFCARFYGLATNLLNP